METQCIRLRLVFDDGSVLSQAQRSEGMNHSWILVDPNQHPKISDVCNHLLRIFNLRSSCPNGIILFMEEFVLPPYESTRILKDKDIICVKRKGLVLAKAIEGAVACYLLDDGEGNKREPVDNGMLLLANEEFDKETGGYKSESEEEKCEEEPSPKETASKKRKASTKLRSSMKKKQRSVVMDRVEDGVATEDDNINNDECLPMKIVSKKIKTNKGKRSGKTETVIVKVKTPKVKRKKKNSLAVVNGAEDEVVTDDDDINKGESLPEKSINKKKIKLNKENNKANGETNDKTIKSSPDLKRSELLQEKVKGAEQASKENNKANCEANDKTIKSSPGVKRSEPLQEKVKGAEQASKENNNANGETNDKTIKSSPDVKRSDPLQEKVKGAEQASISPNEAKKVSSRSSRRKKAKRQWRRELDKISQQPDTHLEPEISKSENKEANGHTEVPLQQDQMPVKIVHKNTVEQEGTNHNDNRDTELVPRVVRPGHIRFENLDEDADADAQQTQVPDVAFEWNGITSKKKGQKWGIEKFSTSRRNDSGKASEESSTMLTADARVPLIDLNDFDQLPLCSSPKEGDVIAYRVLELSSSWTPELSSFRVGKISYYDANNIILMPVPEHPIVSNKMDEDGPENSLYKEDGSLEIKFAALADVRIFKQSNSDGTKPVSNGFNQTPLVDEKNAVPNVMFSMNDKANLSKDPSPVVSNKEGNTWEELSEALSAKKSELLEMNEEMKKDSGWNKWSYRALRGSALGPTMALLRSKNSI